jgi:hypothetical protein
MTCCRTSAAGRRGSFDWSYSDQARGVQPQSDVGASPTFRVRPGPNRVKVGCYAAYTRQLRANNVKLTVRNSELNYRAHF